MFAGIECRKAVHICYGYARNIAEKRATPVYNLALELLASTTADASPSSTSSRSHQPDLLEHAGDKTVILGALEPRHRGPRRGGRPHRRPRPRRRSRSSGRTGSALAPDCGMWFLPRDHARAKVPRWRQPPRCCGRPTPEAGSTLCRSAWVAGRSTTTPCSSWRSSTARPTRSTTRARPSTTGRPSRPSTARSPRAPTSSTSAASRPAPATTSTPPRRSGAPPVSSPPSGTATPTW